MKSFVALLIFTLAIAATAVAGTPPAFPAPGTVVMVTWGNNFQACAIVMGPQKADQYHSVDVVLIYPQNMGGADNPMLTRMAIQWKALPWDGNPIDPMTWDTLTSLSLCPTTMQ